jgi:hypothetical protein
LATLGVAIAAGTLSLAGLFLRLQQDLLISKSTLANVTPTAHAALVRRQDYLAIGIWLLPWFVAVGFLGGLGLSVYGMVGWAKRQKISDELEDIDLHKGRAELQRMSDEQRADKLDRDAIDSAESLATTTPTTQQASGTQVDITSRLLSNLRTEVAVIETALMLKLGARYSQHDIVGGARIRTPQNRSIEVDVVLRPHGPHPVVFELKYASTTKNVLNRIVDGLQQLARAASALVAKGVLVVVVADAATAQQVEEWEQQGKEIASTYKSEPTVYVSRYTDFIEMDSTEFLAQVGLS